MSQSLAKVYLHLVFHVKYTSVVIREEDSPNLYSYIDGIIVNKNAMVLQIGELLIMFIFYVPFLAQFPCPI